LCPRRSLHYDTLTAVCHRDLSSTLDINAVLSIRASVADTKLTYAAHRYHSNSSRCSNAGTNLKVGAPVRSESGGTDPGIFLGRALPLFGSKSTISRFGERFRDGQHSLVSFLFFYSRCPRAPCSRRHIDFFWGGSSSSNHFFTYARCRLTYDFINFIPNFILPF